MCAWIGGVWVDDPRACVCLFVGVLLVTKDD